MTLQHLLSQLILTFCSISAQNCAPVEVHSGTERYWQWPDLYPDSGLSNKRLGSLCAYSVSAKCQVLKESWRTDVKWVATKSQCQEYSFVFYVKLDLAKLLACTKKRAYPCIRKATNFWTKIWTKDLWTIFYHPVAFAFNEVKKGFLFT